jgi:hypothetical protein
MVKVKVPEVAPALIHVKVEVAKLFELLCVRRLTAPLTMADSSDDADTVADSPMLKIGAPPWKLMVAVAVDRVQVQSKTGENVRTFPLTDTRL